MKRQRGCRYSCLVIAFAYFTTCKAQEKPAFKNFGNESGVTHRHNFCSRQEEVYNERKTTVRNALKGLELSVALFDYQLNEETGAIDESFPHIAIQILDEIAKRAGFTYRNTIGVLDSRTGNTTWTEILDLALDTYDVMGEWYLENPPRLDKGIIFPEGWYNGNQILLRRKNSQKYNKFDMFAFASPFTWEVWILIGVITVVSGIMYYVLDFFDSRLKKKKMDIGFEESLFYTAFSFHGHFVHEPKSRATRIMVFSLGFFYLIIVAAYTANLASFLVSENKSSVDINGIQDGKENGMIFCVWRATAVDEYLQTFQIPESNIYRTDYAGEEFLAISEGKCDLLLTTYSNWQIHKRSLKHNPECNLEMVGQIVKFESAGFSMKDSELYCTSLLRNVFHLHISDMKSSGIMDKIWKGHLKSLATNKCASNESASKVDNKYKKMGVENLGGIFVLHTTALVFAVLWTLFRVWHQPRHKRKEMMTEIRNALHGERGLTIAAASARFKKSIFRKTFRKSTSQTMTSTSVTERENENNIIRQKSYLDTLLERGYSHKGFSSIDMSTLFHESQKLDKKVKIMSEDVEELRRDRDDVMERKDEEHKSMIEEICKEYREEIKSICSKHKEEMMEKDINIQKLIKSSQKEQELIKSSFKEHELIKNSLLEQMHTLNELLGNVQK